MSDIPNDPRANPDRPHTDDDTVARLLSLAGPRPAVPADDAAIVKAAARAAWRRSVHARQRRRFYARGAGGLLAAAALVLLVLNTDLGERARHGFATPVASLVTIAGAVTVSGEAITDLGPGIELVAGAVVATAGGEPGRAALALADGTSVRLDAGSALRLHSATVLELERGAVYVDSRSGAALEVRTALGVARDVGTQFEVRLTDGGDALRVRVREGKVLLDRDGETHAATAGVELAVDATGAVDERTVPVHGDEWGWVLALLPEFEVEGRRLGEFLDYAAREAGWTLRFADPALAGRTSVVLHGSIAGLDLEQATAILLAGSGLDYRLEDGVLLIREPS